jgi:hypothetical protein
VDLFYNKIVLNTDLEGNMLKSEINKLLNLSKDEITALNIRFDAKNEPVAKKNPITYENLYFFIDELY